MVIDEEEEKYEEDFEEDEISVEALIEDVKMTRANLREVIKQAISGEISSIDVEETFRSVGEFLRNVEEKIVKLREMEDYGEFDEEDYYDEEDT